MAEFSAGTHPVPVLPIVYQVQGFNLVETGFNLAWRPRLSEPTGPN
jgi:hypothetical protein